MSVGLNLIRNEYPGILGKRDQARVHNFLKRVKAGTYPSLVDLDMDQWGLGGEDDPQTQAYLRRLHGEAYKTHKELKKVGKHIPDRAVLVGQGFESMVFSDNRLNPNPEHQEVFRLSRPVNSPRVQSKWITAPKEISQIGSFRLERLPRRIPSVVDRFRIPSVVDRFKDRSNTRVRHAKGGHVATYIVYKLASAGKLALDARNENIMLHPRTKRPELSDPGFVFDIPQYKQADVNKFLATVDPSSISPKALQIQLAKIVGLDFQREVQKIRQGKGAMERIAYARSGASELEDLGMTRDQLIDLLVEEFIQVVGYSGAGKTTLMKELKSSFPKLQVFDMDVWQGRRYDQIQTGEYSPKKSLKVDALVRSDLREFAKRFEDSDKKHGLVVGIHFTRGPKKWHKYQLDTGSLRSTYRMLKRDKGNRLDIKAYAQMLRWNKWDRDKYRALGYTSISPRQLKAKVASLYEK